MLLTTGTSTLAADQRCVAESSSDAACYCEGQPVANACDGGRCVDMSDGDSVCVDGSRDGTCVREAYRGCRNDGDCPAEGDHCELHLRECLGSATATAGVEEPLVRNGRADGGSSQALVSAFCVPPGRAWSAPWAWDCPRRHRSASR